MALDASARNSLIDQLAGQNFSGLTDTPKPEPTTPAVSEPPTSAETPIPQAAPGLQAPGLQADKPNGSGPTAAVTPPAPGVKAEPPAPGVKLEAPASGTTPEAPTAADTKQVEDLPALPEGKSEGSFQVPYKRLKDVIAQRETAKQEAARYSRERDALQAQIRDMEARLQAGVVGQPPRQDQTRTPPGNEKDWLDEYVDEAAEPASSDASPDAADPYSQLEQRLHRIEMAGVERTLDREVEAAHAAFPELSKAAYYKVVAKNPGVNLTEYAERARDVMMEHEERVIARYLDRKAQEAPVQAPVAAPQAELAPEQAPGPAKPTVFPRPRASGSGPTATAKPQIRTIKEASAAVLAALEA